MGLLKSSSSSEQEHVQKVRFITLTDQGGTLTYYVSVENIAMIWRGTNLYNQQLIPITVIRFSAVGSSTGFKDDLFVSETPEEILKLIKKAKQI